MAKLYALLKGNLGVELFKVTSQEMPKIYVTKGYVYFEGFSHYTNVSRGRANCFKASQENIIWIENSAGFYYKSITN